MSVDALLRPLHVGSTRVYESGPSNLVVKPEELSSSKQEEWTTSRKKEELVTKQIETRVQREIYVDENGEIVEAGDPDITTNTTEDVKTDETETTEHKTAGEDNPGPGWILVPGSTVVKEKIIKRNTNRETKEEKTEAEELEEFNGIPREKLMKAINSKRRHAIKERERHSSSGSRPSPTSETVVETDETKETSEAFGDLILSTNKEHTHSRELMTSPSASVDEVDGQHISRPRRNGVYHERPRTSPPSPPPVFTRMRDSPPCPPTTVRYSGRTVHSPVSPSDGHISVTVSTPLSSPPVSSLYSKKNDNTSIINTGGKAKEKDTSRWVQSHFGATPNVSTTVSYNSPTSMKENSNIQYSTPEALSPKKFSAIKDYFQNAVEQTENYFTTERSNTINRRDRSTKTSSSSSGSNTPIQGSRPNQSSLPMSSTNVSLVNGFEQQRRAKSTERPANRTLRRTESMNDEIPSPSRSPSREKHPFSRSPAHHDDYTAYSTMQRGKSSDFSIPQMEEQELNVQRIINSLRSPQLKDSSFTSPIHRTNSPTANTKTNSRISSDGKHVIKISIPTSSSNPSLYSPNDLNRHSNLHDDRISSPVMNDISPSRRLRMKLSNGSSLAKNSHLNRSTPSLNKSALTTNRDYASPDRSVSSLGLNEIGKEHGSHGYSLRKGQSKSGSSSIWISNNENDLKRQQFMQGLLKPKDINKPSNGYHSPYSSSPSLIESPTTTPTPPPRQRQKHRQHPSNKFREPVFRDSVPSPSPPLLRPTSPESASSPKPSYYLGESDIPPRSDSPITRIEKTTKRRVTTTKTRVQDDDPYPDHVWRSSPANEGKSRSRRHRVHHNGK